MIFVDAQYEHSHNLESTQPATAAIFGHNCADLASLNELANATITSGSLGKFWLSRSIIRWRRQSYKTLKLGKWKWYIFFFRRFECKQHVFHNLRSCKCNSCLRWVYQMREIHFEIHISSKQYSSDTSITGSHFFRNFLFIGGCPTVPVSNVSLSLSWACDPYIGEQIILYKFIVMMMLFWNSIAPLCRPVDLRQLLRSYKCCLRSSHNTGIKNTE